MNKNKAFTLAEVLITLAIIGVVASMTVPALQKNINDAQYNVAAKKAFGNLTQVMKLLNANGEADLFEETGGTNADLKFRNAFAKYMNNVKEFTSTSSEFSGAYHYKSSILRTEPKFKPSITLNDGSTYLFYDSTKAGCSGDVGHEWSGWCGSIWVDTNGIYKKPNMHGYDFLYFLVIKYKGTYMIYPYGGYNPYGYTYDNCAANNSSYNISRSCTFRRLHDPSRLP